jgi:hypothetical protein
MQPEAAKSHDRLFRFRLARDAAYWLFKTVKRLFYRAKMPVIVVTSMPIAWGYDDQP